MENATEGEFAKWMPSDISKLVREKLVANSKLEVLVLLSGGSITEFYPELVDTCNALWQEASAKGTNLKLTIAPVDERLNTKEQNIELIKSTLAKLKPINTSDLQVLWAIMPGEEEGAIKGRGIGPDEDRGESKDKAEDKNKQLVDFLDGIARNWATADLRIGLFGVDPDLHTAGIFPPLTSGLTPAQFEERYYPEAGSGGNSKLYVEFPAHDFPRRLTMTPEAISYLDLVILGAGSDKHAAWKLFEEEAPAGSGSNDEDNANGTGASRSSSPTRLDISAVPVRALFAARDFKAYLL